MSVYLKLNELDNRLTAAEEALSITITDDEVRTTGNLIIGGDNIKDSDGTTRITFDPINERTVMSSSESRVAIFESTNLTSSHIEISNIDYKWHMIAGKNALSAGGLGGFAIRKNVSTGTGITGTGILIDTDLNVFIPNGILSTNDIEADGIITATSQLVSQGTGLIDGLLDVGSLSVNAGNIAIQNGNGIDFSDNSSTPGIGASATSQIFDDYEEGTWTPLYFGETVTGNFTYNSITSGYYTKIGRVVYIQGVIVTNTVGISPTGSMAIAGLPYTVLNTNGNYPPFYISVFANWKSNMINISLEGTPNSTNIKLFKTTAAGTSNNTRITFATDVTAGAGNNLTFAGYYFTA